MRILCKFPTRGRPPHFLQRLREWTQLAYDPANIAFLVSYDADDATMNDVVISQAEAIHPAVICVKGNSKSKIEACNSDLPGYAGDWDVVLLISDDMIPARAAWDDLIRKMMGRYFPDTNGALWFWDGAQKKINTLECVGRVRWAMNGHIYHPSYFSFFCDDETTALGLRDKKLVFIDEAICHHHHPAWLGGMKPDETYKRNNKYWQQDSANFTRRQALGFPQ
jgi:hypothetical protein